MKNLKTLSLLLLSLLTFNLSCNKDDEPSEKQVESPGRENIDVTVTLPEGSKLDLGDTYLYTLGTNANVNSQGKASASIFEGSTELAFLFNSKNEPLLAGFLSIEKNEISINSTAEVLLYYAVPAYMQSSDLKNSYLESISTLNSFSSFSAGLENLFKTDNLVLQKGSYKSLLQEQLDLFSVTDMTSKTSKTSKNISIDSKDERSGLILDEENNNNIQIKNKYSRNAHAFIYKKSTKDLNGQETILNPKVTGSNQAETKFEIKKATHSGPDVKADIRSIKIACQTERFAITTTEAVELNLSDDQSEAKYEVTVIGPGANNTGREMTNDERTKFVELSKKAFVLDYFLPIAMDIVGRKSELDILNGIKDEALYTTILPYLDSNDEVLSYVLSGKYQSATETFFTDIYKLGSGYGDAFRIMQGIYDVLAADNPNAYNYKITDAQKDNETKILEIISEIMKLESFDCLNYFLKDVSTSESWTVTVDKGNVKLAPQTAVVSVLATAEKTQEIAANVQVNLETGEFIEYEWKTTTKFGGVINDLNGKSGSTFTSTFNKVYFLSNTSASQLSDGDNIEEVSVTAFVKRPTGRTEVGKATMQVYVIKSNYIMSPNNGKISGNTSSIMLIEHLDAKIRIPNDNTDYKIVWTTTGNHGQFDSGKTSVTKYNTANIKYVCTDTETKTGTEKFTAVIYAKSKNSAEDYKLAGETQGTLTLDNTDPKKIYLMINHKFHLIESFPEATGSRQSWRHSFFVKKMPNAINYQLNTDDVFDGDNNNYRKFGWYWNNDTTSYINQSEVAGDFELILFRSSLNNVISATTLIRLQGVKATAQLTVTLE